MLKWIPKLLGLVASAETADGDTVVWERSKIWGATPAPLFVLHTVRNRCSWIRSISRFTERGVGCQTPGRQKSIAATSVGLGSGLKSDLK